MGKIAENSNFGRAALGGPREQVLLKETAPGDIIKYWPDPQVVHHVPKRRLADIILD